MGRTFLRQDVQIDRSETYDDSVAPSIANYQTNPASLEADLNNVRSMLSYLKDKQSGNWYDTLLSPSTFESGTTRGVDNLNQDLHDLERKRVLRTVTSVVDVTVPAAQNWVVLALGELPTNTTAAIGAVTTRGTVVATATSFAAHNLDEVSGSSAISPKNLVGVVDASTRDPVLDSSGRVIYGLAQCESSTDGSTMTGTTPNRMQVSFVVLNAAGNDLIACTVADIQGKIVDFQWVERVYLLGLSEQDFLRGAAVDVPSSATVTRQVAYDNQGTTPVELTGNALLDLNSAGIYWQIRDLANASLFKVTEGSTGGTTVLEVGGDVDTFDVNAVVNDFAAGVTARSGGSYPIAVGVTDGTLATTAGPLRVAGYTDLYLDDANQTGSTWAQTNGIKLSAATAEWDLFETNFGEVSLLNAINQAYAGTVRSKVYAVVTTTINADTNASGPSGDNNLDTNLGDLSGGNFINDYDVYLNGVLLRGGADASANHDYYPGTSLAAGQLKFEFKLTASGSHPDQLTIVKY